MGGSGGQEQEEVVGLGLHYGQLEDASLARMRCSACLALGSGPWSLTGSPFEHQLILSALMLRKNSGTILTRSCFADLRFWLEL